MTHSESVIGALARKQSALGETRCMASKLAVAFAQMARGGEFRLVCKDVILREIGTDNVAFWHEYEGDEDEWFCLAAGTKWRYEVLGAGETALHALAEYVVVANSKELFQPSVRLPEGMSKEERLLTAIFSDLNAYEREKAAVLIWLRANAGDVRE